MSQKPIKRYTVGEEVFNSVSHGVGALFSVIGASVLVTLAACFGDLTSVLSCVVYGISMVILYTMSTLYHAFPFEKVKKVFRIFDHTSIFILIAGTYTPFCLLALRGNPKGVWVAVTVWVCALAGIVMNAVSLEKTEKLGLVLYVIMGWAIIFAIKDIVAALHGPAFWLLLAGGLAYTGGIVFYKLKYKYMHSIWHLFVFTGTLLHYLCVAIYVLPMSY
ncbi:MAG: hemolysin III family protein [Ruminococcaceae bacterium]|nr:hemolysin III family protein [Oscillospiraceae bacterium]